MLTTCAIVLTLRVAYLVIEKRRNPSEIIVVTFTTKAANEMKVRLIKLIGHGRTNRLLIGTFHAICSRLLHKYAGYAGVDPKFTICDTDQRYYFHVHLKYDILIVCFDLAVKISLQPYKKTKL